MKPEISASKVSLINCSLLFQAPALEAGVCHHPLSECFGTIIPSFLAMFRNILCLLTLNLSLFPRLNQSLNYVIIGFPRMNLQPLKLLNSILPYSNRHRHTTSIYNSSSKYLSLSTIHPKIKFRTFM